MPAGPTSWPHWTFHPPTESCSSGPATKFISLILIFFSPNLVVWWIVQMTYLKWWPFLCIQVWRSGKGGVDAPLTPLSTPLVQKTPDGWLPHFCKLFAHKWQLRFLAVFLFKLKMVIKFLLRIFINVFSLRFVPSNQTNLILLSPSEATGKSRNFYATAWTIFNHFSNHFLLHPSFRTTSQESPK